MICITIMRLATFPLLMIVWTLLLGPWMWMNHYMTYTFKIYCLVYLIVQLTLQDIAKFIELFNAISSLLKQLFSVINKALLYAVSYNFNLYINLSFFVTHFNLYKMHRSSLLCLYHKYPNIWYLPQFLKVQSKRDKETWPQKSLMTRRKED